MAKKKLEEATVNKEPIKQSPIDNVKTAIEKPVKIEKTKKTKSKPKQLAPEPAIQDFGKLIESKSGQKQHGIKLNIEIAQEKKKEETKKKQAKLSQECKKKKEIALKLEKKVEAKAKEVEVSPETKGHVISEQKPEKVIEKKKKPKKQFSIEKVKGDNSDYLISPIKKPDQVLPLTKKPSTQKKTSSKKKPPVQQVETPIDFASLIQKTQFNQGKSTTPKCVTPSNATSASGLLSAVKQEVVFKTEIKEEPTKQIYFEIIYVEPVRPKSPYATHFEDALEMAAIFNQDLQDERYYNRRDIPRNLYQLQRRDLTDKDLKHLKSHYQGHQDKRFILYNNHFQPAYDQKRSKYYAKKKSSQEMHSLFKNLNMTHTYLPEPQRDDHYKSLMQTTDHTTYSGYQQTHRYYDRRWRVKQRIDEINNLTKTQKFQEPNQDREVENLTNLETEEFEEARKLISSDTVLRQSQEDKLVEIAEKLIKEEYHKAIKQQWEQREEEMRISDVEDSKTIIKVHLFLMLKYSNLYHIIQYNVCDCEIPELAKLERFKRFEIKREARTEDDAYQPSAESAIHLRKRKRGRPFRHQQNNSGLQDASNMWAVVSLQDKNSTLYMPDYPQHGLLSAAVIQPISGFKQNQVKTSEDSRQLRSRKIQLSDSSEDQNDDETEDNSDDEEEYYQEIVQPKFLQKKRGAKYSGKKRFRGSDKEDIDEDTMDTFSADEGYPRKRQKRAVTPIKRSCTPTRTGRVLRSRSKSIPKQEEECLVHSSQEILDFEGDSKKQQEIKEVLNDISWGSIRAGGVATRSSARIREKQVRYNDDSQ